MLRPDHPILSCGSDAMSLRPTVRGVIAYRALTGLALLLLTGCFPDSLLQPCADCAAPLEPAAAKDGEKKEGEKKEAEKPPSPRTLCESLAAYWKTFHSHPGSSDGEEKDKEKKNDKEPNGIYDKDKKNGNNDKPDKDKPDPPDADKKEKANG